MSNPALKGQLEALTQSILRNEIDVETARHLVIEAHALREEFQEAIAGTLTNEQAAHKMGMSRATFYRRKALVKIASSGGAH